SEHLSLHDVDLNKTPMTLGPWLTMDSGTERFTGEFSDQANMYLSRNYRAPFTVPVEV
ncbi:MAG TPA: dehydrogenase, partial [Phycisphaerales bacterium]|nr:dehydrogenase [Phycisphaerales bacterium]